jgi:uncharacterized protein YggE
MESKPDTIRISVDSREEVQAAHADLFVNVKGSSLVSGNEALKKAKEVSQLVEALISFGLSPEAIQLRGVHAEASSGVILKSSSATYELKIRCDDLDQFADLLAIVTSQKNTTMEYIEWKYDEETVYEQALERAMAKAKIKAQKIASQLGVFLLGIYEFKESGIGMGPERMEAGSAQSLRARATGFAASPELNINVYHRKEFIVNVDIEYRVSEFEKSGEKRKGGRMA